MRSSFQEGKGKVCSAWRQTHLSEELKESAGYRKLGICPKGFFMGSWRTKRYLLCEWVGGLTPIWRSWELR